MGHAHMLQQQQGKRKQQEYKSIYMPHTRQVKMQAKMQKGKGVREKQNGVVVKCLSS